MPTQSEMTLAGYATDAGTWPNDVRIGHYDRNGVLIREVEHDGGRFAEPLKVDAGECVAVLIPSSTGMHVLRAGHDAAIQ